MTIYESGVYWLYGDGLNLPQEWHLVKVYGESFYLFGSDVGGNMASWPEEHVVGPLGLESPEEPEDA